MGFAIRDEEVESLGLFTLMQDTINTINHRYGTERVKYTVILYGNINSTSVDFSNRNVNHRELISIVTSLERVPGAIDLQAKLTDAEALFRSLPSIQGSKKVFIVLTDVTAGGNESAITSAGASLVREGILVFSVNRSEDGTSVVTVTQIDYLDIPTFTTDRSVVIAETIIRKASSGKISAFSVRTRFMMPLTPAKICLIHQPFLGRKSLFPYMASFTSFASNP